ncbi:MAG: tol-pal system YbgF family protein, partial [Bradymonadaceae bacterium]
ISFLKAAYEIIAHPNLRYRIALSHERAGNPTEAIEHYRKFLDEKPKTSKREEVEKRIERLNDQIAASVHIESEPSGATVLVRSAGASDTDPRDRGETPLKMKTSPGRIE